MVTILPPEVSVTFLAALLGPLILGFLVGLIAKSVLKIGLAVAAIVIILIAMGIIAPEQVLTPLISLFKSGSGLASKVDQLAGYLPYSSIAFIAGLVVGFFKG